eukprot:6730796-Prymnesium_polylepis.1
MGAMTSPARCMLLHRSRRQHYSPVLFRGRGLVDIMSLPEATRALWPRLRELTCRSDGTAAEGSLDGHPGAVAKRQRGQ